MLVVIIATLITITIFHLSYLCLNIEIMLNILILLLIVKVQFIQKKGFNLIL